MDLTDLIDTSDWIFASIGARLEAAGRDNSKVTFMDRLVGTNFVKYLT